LYTVFIATTHSCSYKGFIEAWYNAEKRREAGDPVSVIHQDKKMYVENQTSKTFDFSRLSRRASRDRFGGMNSSRFYQPSSQMSRPPSSALMKD
jgi:hypothetical protein